MNLQQKINDATTSVKKNLKTILMDLGVVMVSFLYVFYQVLTLEKTNLNPFVLIGKALIGIIVGILIKQALGENGFTKGYKTETWERASKSYNSKAETALPYIDKVETFYDNERAEKMLKNRKTRLAGCRMKYEDFFDAEGNYKHQHIMARAKYEHLKKKAKRKHLEYEKPEGTVVLDLRQRICLAKCIKLKIYIRNLFTEYETDLSADEHKEINDKDQRAKNLRKNTLSATIIALLGVYFIPNFVWNWGNIIWALFQVALWITFGIIQLYDNYNFITVEKVNLLKLKETDLAKFLFTCYKEDKNNDRKDFADKFLNIKKEEKQVDPPQEQEKPSETEVEMTEEQARELGLIK